MYSSSVAICSPRRPGSPIGGPGLRPRPWTWGFPASDLAHLCCAKTRFLVLTIFHRCCFPTISIFIQSPALSETCQKNVFSKNFVPAPFPTDRPNENIAKKLQFLDFLATWPKWIISQSKLFSLALLLHFARFSPSFTFCQVSRQLPGKCLQISLRGATPQQTSVTIQGIGQQILLAQIWISQIKFTPFKIATSPCNSALSRFSRYFSP